MVESAAIQQISAQLDRYEVIDEIGRGGMGVVYRVYEPALDRSLALKVVSPELAHQPGFVERLRREAISAARLRHPNIALLYEFGQTADTAFLVMEYVPGCSLRQLLEAGPLSTERSLHILSQIGGALDYAHRMGVIHRDVKPSNILIGAGEQAMLIDFGLADMAENPHATVDTAVLGTPHYMSPEQAAGRSVDARSDQYSLAAVAYELLTGVPLFGGRSASAVVHAHLYEAPAPPTEYRPTLPIGVNHVLLRALAKSPYERYSSLAAMLDDLRAMFIAPPPERASAPRHWLAFGLALLGLATAIGLAVALSGAFAQARPPDLPSQELPLPKQVAWTYDTPLVGGPPLALAGDTLVIGTLDGALIGLRAAGGEPRWRRGGELAVFGAPSATNQLIFVGVSDGAMLALSPASGEPVWRTAVVGAVRLAPTIAGDRLVVATEKGYLYLLRASNGQPFWSRPLAALTQPASMEAERILAVSGSSLSALDARNGVVDWEFQSPSAINTQPVVAGDRILVGTERGVLYTLDLASGRQLAAPYQARSQLSAAPVVGAGVAFVADRSGTLVALVASNLASEQWRFTAGAAIDAAPLLEDGKLFFGASDGAFYVLDAATGRVLSELHLQSSISAPPVRSGGLIYVRGDRVYALGA